MTEENINSLLPLVGEITASYVAANSVSAAEVPALIRSIHAALVNLGQAAPEPEAAKPQGAVTLRKSLAEPDFLISMIDGRKYRSLTRHLRHHGLDAAAYRKRFGLPADYPMVSKGYSEARRSLALAIGLGRKAGQTTGKVVEKAGKALAAAEQQVEAAVRPRRGRPRKALGDALASAKQHLGKD